MAARWTEGASIVLLYKMTLFGFKSESAEVIRRVGLFPVCSLSSRYFN